MPDQPELPPASEPRPPLTVIPVPRPAPPPPPPPRAGSGFRAFFWFLFLISLGANFLLLMMLAGVTTLGFGEGLSDHVTVHEHFHSGKRESKNKIAIIKVDGVIMEGMLRYAQKEIEEAAGDSNVKAVVLRINSPGGTITASDEMYRRLVNLRDGKTPGHHSPAKKPIVVSMGSLTASGGYYIAMAAQRLVAERTTITGSIGVYAAFPNFYELAKRYGFEMIVVKSDALKDSGSPFKPMLPQERELWKDMVDHVYKQFLAVVEEGRPQLKGKLQEEVENRKLHVDAAGKDTKKETVEYIRKRADGGIFTADKALEYGLIDQIGYLEDAVAEASKAASLGDDYKAVTYQKPLSLMDILGGVSQRKPVNGGLDMAQLAELATPRLWYLAPQSNIAGMLSALGRE